jgi:putative photosynthetic complex assembly protein
MSELHRTPAPPVLLLAACGLALVAIAAAWIGGKEDRDLRATLAPAVHERTLVFVGDVTGEALTVLDGGTGDVIEQIPPGESTFIRGMLRGIGRERDVKGIAADVPLLLSARADGSVTVVDEGTGIVYDLRAFGSGNVREFARLLDAQLDPDRVAAGEADNLQTRTRKPGP